MTFAGSLNATVPYDTVFGLDADSNAGLDAARDEGVL